MKIRMGAKPKRAETAPLFQVDECVGFTKEIEAMNCGVAFARFLVSPGRTLRTPALAADVAVGLGTVRNKAKQIVERYKYSGRMTAGMPGPENPYGPMVKAAQKVRTLASKLMHAIGDPPGYESGSGKPRALPKGLAMGSLRKLIGDLDASVDKVRAAAWKSCGVPGGQA